MKNLFFTLLLAIISCSSGFAQNNDLSWLFRVSGKCSSIAYCTDTQTNTIWINHVTDIFTFDSNGNLLTYNDNPLSNVVRNEYGQLESFKCNGHEYTVVVLSDQISVLELDPNDSDWFCRYEFHLNKKGLVTKKIMRTPRGTIFTANYTYKEFSGNNWYIRKSKVEDSLDKWTQYDCLKIY